MATIRAKSSYRAVVSQFEIQAEAQAPRVTASRFLPIGWRNRKPLDATARDRGRQKAARAHFGEGRVDRLKPVLAVEGDCHGLRHAVEVVVEHSQARNVARAAGEPLPSTREG